MGNQSSAQAVNPSDAELAKLESLFQSNSNLVLLKSAFNVLCKGRSSGLTRGENTSGTVLHADLKALFDLPVPDGSSESAQAAVRSFNAHVVVETFGKAPGGVTYPAFLGGMARGGKLGSKKEQIELILRCFVGSALTEGCAEQGERARSNGSASTSAPSEDPSGNSSAKEGIAISRSQLEGILLALWYLTSCNRQSLMFRNQGKPSPGGGSKDAETRDSSAQTIQWPDLRPLVDGAFKFDKATGIDRNAEVPSKQGLPLEKLVTWAVSTLPGLSDVLEPYLVRQCCHYLDQTRAAGNDDDQGTENAGPADSIEKNREVQEDTAGDEDASWKPGMLTPGVAWSIGLATSFGTAKWGVGPRLTDLGCGGGDLTRLVGRPRLLYRSSEHGRGMNRMMSHVEGYSGTVLVVIAARPLTSGDNWSIGALLPDGLDNKRGYFGSSNSCLFSLKPAFKVFRASGRDSNFVYCHARIAGQGYQSHPLPEGFGLGGTLGKERVWLDDNATPGKVTVRHHAVDKTYQPGALVPELGYGGLDARVEDVEVWGLGGQQADSKQRAYLEREQRFQEQRRKIDMKKFAEGWQDSPDRLILEWGGART